MPERTGWSRRSYHMRLPDLDISASEFIALQETAERLAKLREIFKVGTYEEAAEAAARGAYLNIPTDAVPEDVFQAVTKQDPTSRLDASGNVTKCGIYSQWLLGQYVAMGKEGRSRYIEDLHRFVEALQIFDRRKGRLPVDKRNITNIKTIHELEALVEPLKDQQTRGEKRKEVEAGEAEVDVVLDTADWLVVRTKTLASSIFYGKGTRWCTAGSQANHYFHSYSKQGPLFVVMDRKNGRKWQFHVPTNQYMDEQQTGHKSIDIAAFTRQHPEVGKAIVRYMVAAYKGAGDGRKVAEHVSAFDPNSAAELWKSVSDPSYLTGLSPLVLAKGYADGHFTAEELADSRVEGAWAALDDYDLTWKAYSELPPDDENKRIVALRDMRAESVARGLLKDYVSPSVLDDLGLLGTYLGYERGDITTHLADEELIELYKGYMGSDRQSDADKLLDMTSPDGISKLYRSEAVSADTAAKHLTVGQINLYLPEVVLLRLKAAKPEELPEILKATDSGVAVQAWVKGIVPTQALNAHTGKRNLVFDETGEGKRIGFLVNELSDASEFFDKDDAKGFEAVIDGDYTYEPNNQVEWVKDGISDANMALIEKICRKEDALDEDGDVDWDSLPYDLENAIRWAADDADQSAYSDTCYEKYVEALEKKLGKADYGYNEVGKDGKTTHRVAFWNGSQDFLKLCKYTTSSYEEDAGEYTPLTEFFDKYQEALEMNGELADPGNPDYWHHTMDAKYFNERLEERIRESFDIEADAEGDAGKVVERLLNTSAEEIIETVRRKRDRLIKPWLMTWEEYYKLVNPDGKSHPSSAYNYTVDKLSWVKRDKFPYRLKRVNGIDYMAQKESLRYMRDIDKHVRQKDGTPIEYMTPDEMKAADVPDTAVSLAAFDGDTCVGVAQDEWGCVLYAVADEYRGEGIGTTLGKLYRSIYPSKSSGGFTASGASAARRIHRQFVEDAWRTGKYRRAVAAGEVTQDRVDEIVDSASEGNWMQAHQDAHPDWEHRGDEKQEAEIRDWVKAYRRKQGDAFRSKLAKPPEAGSGDTPRAKKERIALELYRRAMASPYLSDNPDPEEVRQVILSDDKLGEWLWSKENEYWTDELYDYYIPWVQRKVKARAAVDKLLA